MSPPFPTVPLTVDIIIEMPDGRIVLIGRRDPPLGLAIPGGFVEPGESAAKAAVREAKEETGLDVILTRQFHTYSKPGRDPRGPVASVVFLARTAFDTQQPVAGDDAKTCHLFRVMDILKDPGLAASMAFDHCDILEEYYDWRAYGLEPPVES